MTSTPSQESRSKNQHGHFLELLKVEGKLDLREPIGPGMGIIFPIALLVLFWAIGTLQPGAVGSSGLTVLELYIPTIIVIGFISTAINSLPRSLVRDRDIGWLRRVSTTPVHPSRLLAAQLILNLTYSLVATLVVIFGGEAIFGASLDVNVPFFVLSLILSLAVIFSLGLVITAIAPSQSAAAGMTGLLFFGLLFLSGLWLQPTLVGGALQTIMYYSPSGAAVLALLDSVSNVAPPYTAIVTMVVYTIIFALIAIRYFRWE